MKIKDYVAVFVAIAGLTFASCSDDNNGPSYDPNGVEVANAELKTKLQALGYNFNEKGNLLQDEKVQKTTSLDLSNANLTSAKGLDVFPNLTEVKLSNNKFGKSFDFNQLPQNVVSIDLTKNTIYECKGLLDESEETGDITSLRKFSNMKLPESIKYDCDELPLYFIKNKNVSIFIEDEDGKITNYTTLRDVQDATVRDILVELYPSLFTADKKIDISKRMVKPDEKNKNLWINYMNDPNGKVKSVEGVEYIILNPSFQGNSIDIESSEECTIPYLKLNNNISQFKSVNINTPDLDFIKAKNLCAFYLENNKDITNLDFRNCVLMGQRGFVEEDPTKNPSIISVVNCEKLESISIPPKAKYFYSIDIEYIPLLKKLDLSMLDYVGDHYCPKKFSHKVN